MGGRDQGEKEGGAEEKGARKRVGNALYQGRNKKSPPIGKKI